MIYINLKKANCRKIDTIQLQLKSTSQFKIYSTLIIQMKAQGDNLYYDEVIVDDDDFICNISVCSASKVETKMSWFGWCKTTHIRLQKNVK